MFAARLLTLLVLVGASPAVAQPQQQPPAHAYDLDSSYLRWPLPAGEDAYSRIDGVHLKGWVEEMAAISRRSRERGDRYWGRIAGATSDEEVEAWVVEQFGRVGLQDVHEQPFDLAPQWFPTAWGASADNGETRVELLTAHPAKGSPPTPESGLELDAVWVGLGTAADFQGRDVRGRAVLVYSMPTPSVIRHSAQWNGAAERAAAEGAAAVFIVLGIPGSFTTQLNSTYGANVPTFSLGLEDGERVRRLLEEGRPVRIKVHLATEIREGLQCASVWGTLPGTSEENVIVIAHHDAYFEGALDNASGTAVMLGLAEYFASKPRESRQRTLHFVSTAGHHAGSLGTRWMHENRSTVLDQTVLMINSEHVSVTQTYLWGPRLRKSNTVDARRWWVFGSSRLRDIVLDAYSTFGVAIYHQMEPTASGDMGVVCRDLPSVQIIESPAFYHSDHDTPAFVPAAGLEAMARAYAKIMQTVDTLERQDLVAE